MRPALCATIVCNIGTMLCTIVLAAGTCVGAGMARGDTFGRPLPPPSALEQGGFAAGVFAIFTLIVAPSLVFAWRRRYGLALVTALPPFAIGATFAWIIRYAFL